MLMERKLRVQALPGWTWNAIEDAWEVGFSYLEDFVEREGRARPSNKHETDDGYQLGKWVGRQRAAKESMPMERRTRLEELPGWSWNPLDDAWEVGFHHLKEFADREGHCRVSREYKAADGFQLGKWVGRQRATKESMSPERRMRLERIAGWL